MFITKMLLFFIFFLKVNKILKKIKKHQSRNREIYKFSLKTKNEGNHFIRFKDISGEVSTQLLHFYSENTLHAFVDGPTRHGQ